MAMSSDEPTIQKENTYVIDSESTAEMARLMRQDQLVTHEMGGLFPEGLDLTNVSRILDVACGPGGWTLETAFLYADKEVVGIDISQKMIEYAQTQAKVQGLTNAHFTVMNALKPLDFPDSSFDLVNMRLAVAFMLPEVWPRFLKECYRILKPGGIIRLTEVEWGFVNKPATEKFMGLSSLALSKAGQSFSPNGLHLGINTVLSRLVQNAGFQHIGKLPHFIDHSYGTHAHEGFYHDLAAAFHLIMPFLAKTGVATQEELDQLYPKVLAEMQMEDFCSVWYLLTVWGYKPTEEPS
jgi:ubiquinone/menaquinone biosynthesis C-methylase UbiE